MLFIIRLLNRWNRIRSETPHVVFLSRFLGSSINTARRARRQPFEKTINIFWPGGLDFWPMTLTYIRDLDILPLDLLPRFKGVHPSVWPGKWDTHRQCQNYYTKHVRNLGCNVRQCLHLLPLPSNDIFIQVMLICAMHWILQLIWLKVE